MPIPRLFGDNEPPAKGGLGKPLSCVSCGLYNGPINPKMPPFGDFKKQIMVIGEGPGEQEDRKGRPFQGPTGNAIKEALSDLGIDLFRDCINLNAVNCRPPSNRAPSVHEIACCRARIVSPAIAAHSPRLMLLLGGSAVTSVLGSVLPEAQDSSIGKWRGFHIPLPELGAWICPTYHPSYVSRSSDRPEVETVWKNDLKQAIDLLNVSVPRVEILRNRIVLLHGEEEILRALNRVKVRKGLFSFDYETVGLSAKLHSIVCASFCQSPERAYAFMFTDASEAVRQAWRDILVNEDIGKISHNLSFEYEWSRFHFDIDEINWAWDSMLAAHVIDNRTGICGLKFQSFINFGVVGYENLIDPYLKSVTPRDPTAPNRILEFIERHGEDECLIYCGIDSLLAYRLTMKQMKEIEDG